MKKVIFTSAPTMKIPHQIVQITIALLGCFFSICSYGQIGSLTAIAAETDQEEYERIFREDSAVTMKRAKRLDEKLTAADCQVIAAYLVFYCNKEYERVKSGTYEVGEHYAEVKHYRYKRAIRKEILKDLKGEKAFLEFSENFRCGECQQYVDLGYTSRETYLKRYPPNYKVSDRKSLSAFDDFIIGVKRARVFHYTRDDWDPNENRYRWTTMYNDMLKKHHIKSNCSIITE